MNDKGISGPTRRANFLQFFFKIQNDNSCAKDNTAFLLYLIWIR